MSVKCKISNLCVGDAALVLATITNTKNRAYYWQRLLEGHDNSPSWLLIIASRFDISTVVNCVELKDRFGSSHVRCSLGSSGQWRLNATLTPAEFDQVTKRTKWRHYGVPG